MTSAAGMPCPICKVALVMSERQGVEIDYCSQCRGVWLDRGELDKIVERSSQENARPPVMHDPRTEARYEPEHRGHSDQYGYRKRKKSFLEELFD
jgi:Zn-finger nucleic acid-binding protein